MTGEGGSLHRRRYCYYKD